MPEPEAIESSTEIDPLQIAETEKATRISWVINELSQRGFQPGRPGTMWNGRDAIIAAFFTKFNGELLDAAKTVDLAVAELWANNTPDDRHVQRELMLGRLDFYREEVKKLIQNGCTEVTYKHEQVPDPKDPTRTTLKRIPFKTKHTGIGLGGIARLLEIERFRAELLGLRIDAESGGGDTTMNTMILGLDQLAEDEKEKVAASVSQMVTKLPSDMLNAAGKQKAMDMLDQIRKNRKGKKVASVATDVPAAGAE